MHISSKCKVKYVKTPIEKNRQRYIEMRNQAKKVVRKAYQEGWGRFIHRETDIHNGQTKCRKH